jgi:hypothetical protein
VSHLQVFVFEAVDLVLDFNLGIYCDNGGHIATEVALEGSEGGRRGVPRGKQALLCGSSWLLHGRAAAFPGGGEHFLLLFLVDGVGDW